MKKLVFAAVAAALVFGLASCGSTKSDEPDLAGFAAEQEAKAAEARKNAMPAGAIAFWDFSKLPADGIITDAYKTFAADLAIPPVDGSAGASFTLLAGSETKYLKGEPSDGGYPFLAHNNRGSATLENIAESAKATYELKLEQPGSVSIVVTGNGDPTPARVVAIADASGKIIAGKDQLGKSPVATVDAKGLAAGSYTVYVAGSRLHKITVTK